MPKRIILFAFHFLLLATPLFFTWFNDELFEFNKMLLTYAVTVILCSAWAVRMIQEKRLIFRRTPFDIPIAIFLLSQLVSTLFSIDPHTSIFGYYTRFNGGLLSFACYAVLFYAFVSNVQKSDCAKLFRSLFVSGALVSLLAIPEHFGHSASCLAINLYRYRNDALPAGWFGQFYDAGCWVQDVQNRVFATFGQPNWLAVYAITLIPLGGVLSFLARKKSPAMSVFYGATTLALLVDLLFTKSRSGVLGLLLGCSVFAAVSAVLFFRSAPRNPTMFRFGLGAVALAAIAILFFGTPYTKNYGEQLLQKSPPSPTQIEAAAPTANRLENGGTDSGEIRQIVWKGALKVWQRYPIFGSGVETFAYSYYQDRPVEHNRVSEWDFLYNKAHNEWLNFLATTGIVGLLSYLVLISAFTLWPLRWVWKNHQENFDQSLLFIALSAGLISMHVSNFFGFSTVMANILLFLFPAIVVVYTQKPLANVVPDDDTSSLVKWSSYGIIGLIGVALLIWVLSIWRADFHYNRGKQYLQANQLENAMHDLETAVTIRPSEATFYDDLTNTYVLGAVELSKQNQATSAAEFANAAINTSQKMLAMSPHNLNLHKTTIRLYISLSQLNPKFIAVAKTAILQAIELSPTDPKLWYFLASVELAENNLEDGIAHLEKTLELKPDYEVAQQTLQNTRAQVASQAAAQKKP